MNELQKYAYSLEEWNKSGRAVLRNLYGSHRTRSLLSFLLAVIGCLAIVTSLPPQVYKTFTREQTLAVGLLPVFILVPLNLLCEALKFRVSCGPGYSVLNCIHLVCKNFAINMFLPFGTGSLIGGIQSCRCEVAYIRTIVVSSASQNLLNLLGAVCLSWPVASLISDIQGNFFRDHIILSCGIFIILIIGITWTADTERIRSSFVPTRLGMRISYFHVESWKFMWPIAGLSLIRYLIYLVQLSFLLQLFSCESWKLIFAAAAMYYALISLVPLPGFFSVFSRMGIASIVFPVHGLDTFDCAFVVGLIYLLNQLLPAMLGCYFLFKDGMRVQL